MSVVALRPQPTLDELATGINREHSLVLSDLSSAVQHALAAGEYLVQVRDSIPHGEYNAWIRDNTNLSRSSVSIYLRMATYGNIVESATSIRHARILLAGEPASFPLGTPPRKWLKDAQALRAGGVSYRDVADALGVSYSAVYKALNPAHELRNYHTSLARKRRRRAERDALKRQERETAMKKAGGDEWDAYVLARKFAALLDKLGMGAEYAKCVAIEDALVKRVKGA